HREPNEVHSRPMERLSYISLLVSVLVLLGPTVSAQAGGDGVDQQLKEYRADFDQARFERALGPLRKLVADEGLTAQQRVTALELLARIHLATGDLDDAREVLRVLYRRDPAHTLKDPNASPKEQGAFQQVKQATSAQLHVEMENLVARRETLRKQPRILIKALTNGDAVDHVRVSFRQGDASEYTDLDIQLDENLVAEALIPPTNSPDAYDVQFFVQAFSPSGGRLGRMGTADKPLKIVIPGATSCVDPNDPACRCEFAPKSAGCPYCLGNPTDPDCSADPCVADPQGQECRCSLDPDTCDEDDGILGAWWFWTAVGVVVLGGGAAGVIIATSGDAGCTSSLGCAQLQ
ncbi:MAG: tetratricopeptide repeat protein, partial [Myxococcales bacterium]|nr:tetratricopeptide repeat protein [Myxococcales bacterium]